MMCSKISMGRAMGDRMSRSSDGSHRQEQGDAVEEESGAMVDHSKIRSRLDRCKAAANAAEKWSRRRPWPHHVLFVNSLASYFQRSRYNDIPSRALHSHVPIYDLGREDRTCI